MTQSAALGLTCRDAFNVFSQNETLRLQTVVDGLQMRLARYEPVQLPARIFECHEDYVSEREDADDYLWDWIDQNVKGCTLKEFEEGGINAICDIFGLHETISYCVYWHVGDKAYSDGLATRTLDVIEAALQSSHRTEKHYWEAFLGIVWCEDKFHVQRTVQASVTEFVDGCLIKDGVVDWKDE